MENENKLKDMIQDTLKDVKSAIDADTLIGKPITTDTGLVIIPISRMSMGIVTGGLNLPSKNNGNHLSGAGGTGVSVEPIAFLTITPDGKTEVVPMVTEAPDTLGAIANTVGSIPEIIRKLKAIWQGLTDDLKREREKQQEADNSNS